MDKSFDTNLNDDIHSDRVYDKPHTFRVLGEEERIRFTIEAWGFLTRLRELGIIDDEVALDDVMIIASLSIFRYSHSLYREEFLDKIQRSKNSL